MFHHFLVVLVLVALGISTPIGLTDPRAAMCLREVGIYDVCDTLHSFLRCKGRLPMMGSCTGLNPPPMNITLSQ
ncbi:hypothetical protein F5X97DRAFT_321745 [Nemania serpens]|nr:hypothetical protein F5X97DRAFT_321745 [Nemania serpens]